VSRLGSAWRHVRRHGVTTTLRTLFSRYVHGRHECLVLHCDLAGPPAADHVGDVVFRLAGEADLDRLPQLDRYGRGSTQRAYVEEDHDWLFVACHGDRIVATRRYSRSLPPHGLMSRVVRLEPGQVWAADVFCLPEYRNQAIARHLMLFAERFLASLDYRELLTSITVTNKASLRMSRHKGSKPLYHVAYFRLLFYERLVITRDIPELIGDWPARPADGALPGPSGHRP
jgi:GNAT superfamily N-acetyltransferase